MEKRHHPSRRAHLSNSSELVHPDLIALWSLRILVTLGGHRQIRPPYDATEQRLLERCGAPTDEPEDGEQKRWRAIVLSNFRARLLRLERHPPELGGILGRNLEQVGKVLSLGPDEKLAAGFAMLLRADPLLALAGRTLGDSFTRGSVLDALSVILGRPRDALAEALRLNGTLHLTGLAQIDDGAYDLVGKIEVKRSLVDVLSVEMEDGAELVGRFLELSAPARLGRADYAHVAEDFDLLCRYLAPAMARGLPGVNVLLHGRPGTGKTELVRTLAAELGAELHAVRVMDDAGDPIDVDGRLACMEIGQRVLARRRDKLVLFDEVDDVLGSVMERGLFESVRTNRLKAQLNVLLEGNALPTFWICNHISGIEPALLRRFQYVLELRNPPRATRERILQRQLAPLPVTEPFVQQLAERDELTPALVDGAVRVVAQLGPGDPSQVERDLTRVISNTLESMGYSRLTASSENALTGYRLDVLNASCDLPSLTAGLRRSGRGRICLFGPPGTGKTAYGQHVAKALERPLIVRRASDILSPYVGQTEQNLAQLFREAADAGAVLLLDEADSFLSDRGRARASWEVTQVNEFLTQMEAFDGILIISTNLVDRLDAASMRRFDVKVQFDYLKPSQAVELLRQVLAEHGGADDAAVKQAETRLASLGSVTPGDFATVLRRLRLLGSPLDAGSIVDGLVEEGHHKPTAKERSIGFTAPI